MLGLSPVETSKDTILFLQKLAAYNKSKGFDESSNPLEGFNFDEVKMPILEELKFHSEKFGDWSIQFCAPPIARASLVSFTESPLTVMWFATRAYKGIYSTSVERIEDYGFEDSLEDIVKTKLQTPLEMIHTLWLLQDVSRAFTHQLVRYRIGTAFVQESMRFLGMKGTYKVLVTNDIHTDFGKFSAYKTGIAAAISAYVNLLESDVPSEDARGTLPTNILTNIFFDCSLRTLQGIFPQRLCCQAQPGEWQLILKTMRDQIKMKMGDKIEGLLRSPYELGKDCGYRASFDRPCVWTKREKTNAEDKT